MLAEKNSCCVSLPSIPAAAGRRARASSGPEEQAGEVAAAEAGDRVASTPRPRHRQAQPRAGQQARPTKATAHRQIRLGETMPVRECA